MSKVLMLIPTNHMNPDVERTMSDEGFVVSNNYFRHGLINTKLTSYESNTCDDGGEKLCDDLQTCEVPYYSAWAVGSDNTYATVVGSEYYIPGLGVRSVDDLRGRVPVDQHGGISESARRKATEFTKMYLEFKKLAMLDSNSLSTADAGDALARLAAK